MEEVNYTGASLEKALASNELSQPSFYLTGMVKFSQKPGYIAFTSAGCDSWVNIPVSIIEKAQKIGSQGCGDHSHPLMKLTIKQPASEEGNLFYALLNQKQSNYTNEGNDFFSKKDLTPYSYRDNFYTDQFFDESFSFPFIRREPICVGGTRACWPYGRCEYKCCRQPDGSIKCTDLGPAKFTTMWF